MGREGREKIERGKWHGCGGKREEERQGKDRRRKGKGRMRQRE